MDVLTDVLAATRVAGSMTAELTASAPWGIQLPDVPVAAFHVVVEGACWLRRRGAQPLQLVAGDVALVPLGGAHALASSSRGPLVPYADVLAAAPAGARHIQLPGPGARTRMLCGGYRYDAFATHPLLTMLPPVLHIPWDDSRERRDLADTVRSLSQEITADLPGSQTVIERLVDVVFVQILRCWLSQHGEQPAWWLAALRDPEVAHALKLIHAEPSRQWTVEELAREVGVSRATLARRFTGLVGEAPLAYLTRWRMELAARQLRSSTDPLSLVAKRVGYTSEFAFSRAFARSRSISPSRYRAVSLSG